MGKKYKEQEPKKLTFKGTLNLALWAIKLSLQVDKPKTILLIITSIVTLIQPIIGIYLVSKLFNQLFEIVKTDNAQLMDMFPILALLLGYNILSSFIGFFESYAWNSLDELTNSRMPRILAQKIQSLGIKELENPETNNLIDRAITISYAIPDYTRSVIYVIGKMIAVIVDMVIIINFSPLLILILILASIPERLVNNKYQKKIWKFMRNNTEESRKNSYSMHGLQSATMLPELIINKSINFIDKKCSKFMEWRAAEDNNIVKDWMLYTRLLDILNKLGIYIGYLFIFYNAIKKYITIGDVYFQTQMLQRLSDDINGALGRLGALFERSMRINEMYELFQMPEENISGVIKLPKLEQGPRIEFKNVTFSYPSNGKKIINKLNLTIKSGEKVAVVGINGAGKTTLMKLISNIYEPTEGEILINGYPLKDIENNTWYENLGALFQEYNQHSELTVKENIIMGNPNIKFDPKKLVEAAQSADAFEFIEQFPDKFDQTLNPGFKGGIKPSGGQWQKIALARFFYRDAPMVIFDEPTAAIDALSEYKIFNKIYKFFKNKTVIIISHRFSTVRNADRILVLDKGKIIEDGTHEELLKLEGKYAQSFNLQAEGYK